MYIFTSSISWLRTISSTKLTVSMFGSWTSPKTNILKGDLNIFDEICNWTAHHLRYLLRILELSSRACFACSPPHGSHAKGGRLERSETRCWVDGCWDRCSGSPLMYSYMRLRHWGTSLRDHLGSIKSPLTRPQLDDLGTRLRDHLDSPASRSECSYLFVTCYGFVWRSNIKRTSSGHQAECDK